MKLILLSIWIGISKASLALIKQGGRYRCGRVLLSTPHTTEAIKYKQALPFPLRPHPFMKYRHHEREAMQAFHSSHPVGIYTCTVPSPPDLFVSVSYAYSVWPPIVDHTYLQSRDTRDEVCLHNHLVRYPHHGWDHQRRISAPSSYTPSPSSPPRKNNTIQYKNDKR